MAKRVKLKNDMYLDTKYSVHNDTILYDYLNNLYNYINTVDKDVASLLPLSYKMSSRNTVNYNQNRWTWGNVSNEVAADSAGLYLCLYTSWVAANLGGEMDLRFRINGYIQRGGAGNALGNKGFAMEILQLNKGDKVGVSMQTSNGGSSTIYDPSIILLKLSGGGVIKYLKNLITNLIGGGENYAYSN